MGTDSGYQKKIIDFYRSNWRMPSYSEIMEITGLKSKDSVFKLVERLANAGSLKKDRRGRLIPSSILSEIKVLGLVEAGIPTMAEQEELETISLDDYLVSDREQTFILRVKGDSMVEAGIHEGDMVVVERKNQAKDGDIVIADVDGGWTMKYLRMKGAKTFLEPANRRYKAIYPQTSLNIAAIVRGVVRKY